MFILQIILYDYYDYCMIIIMIMIIFLKAKGWSCVQDLFKNESWIT